MYLLGKKTILSVVRISDIFVHVEKSLYLYTLKILTSHRNYNLESFLIAKANLTPQTSFNNSWCVKIYGNISLTLARFMLVLN